MTRAYLSLGSNLGDRLEHLREGVRVVVASDPFRVSPVYETEPVGGVEQDHFLNLVVELSTSASPRELLTRARAAENARGRERKVHWGPRTLDVDVLLVGDDVVDEPDLVVPHPRMFERAFVLAPLRDLAPDLVGTSQLAHATGRVVALGTLESLR